MWTPRFGNEFSRKTEAMFRRSPFSHQVLKPLLGPTLGGPSLGGPSLGKKTLGANSWEPTPGNQPLGNNPLLGPTIGTIHKFMEEILSWLVDHVTILNLIISYFFPARYLTFPPGEFAAGPAKSGLLTQHESFAILMNISSPGSWELPDYMNTETEARKIPRDLVPMLSSGT